jgi:hypothetical protein
LAQPATKPVAASAAQISRKGIGVDGLVGTETGERIGNDWNHRPHRCRTL